MKRLMIASALAALATFGVSAAETIGLGKDWLACPVAEQEGADIAQCIPEGKDWQNGGDKGVSLAGNVMQHKDAKKGNLFQGVFNCWYKKSLDVPAAWQGKSVRLEAKLAWITLVVHVNGQKAGVMYGPDGSFELAPFLKFGQKNEIKVFATNRGWGTGETGIKYWARPDCSMPMAQHFDYTGRFGGANVVVRTPAYVDSAYVLSSGRDAQGKWDPAQKKVTVKVEMNAARDCKVEVKADFYNDVCRGNEEPKLEGAVVKSGSKTVSLKQGENVVEIEIPWKDVRDWEVVPNAATYVCNVTAKVDGQDCDTNLKPFVFGFREIWLEGKEFMLNGHVQRFRGYWNQGAPKDMNDLHKYGYNLSYETHKHGVMYDDNLNQKWAQSRAGVAVFSGMPSIYFVHDEIRKDPSCTAQWRRYLRHWLRHTRNLPCIVATSCGVNQICPERNMRPEILGQDPEKGGVVCNIEFARKVAREYHPNCLYFSHADGTEADMSSSNLYFNFTPLQEREEWLSSWAKNGTLPWYAAEFGAPYYACWFHSRTPQMTEWLAAYYGDDAYAAEAPEMLYHANAFAKCCRAMTHGGWVTGDDLFPFNKLSREYSKMLVYRTNRAWRTFGQNGGMMYLESWPWDTPNPTRERQMQANGDLVTWLAGDAEITDRTHAFRSGDAITRNLVAVWDGFGPKTVSADWKFVEKATGKVIAKGAETFKVNQGEVAKKAITVKAPDVKAITGYRFEVAFKSDIDPEKDATFKTVEKDSFDVEVYPTAVPQVAGDAAKLGLYDPFGDSAKMMASLGMKFKTFDSLDAALADKGITRLVLGRRALTKACGLEKAAGRIAAGLKVLVLPQEADVWQIMGLQVEDMMPRVMRNVSLPGLKDESLAYWRGKPMWEKDFGLVMKHDTRRGPRWKHTHAVGGLAMLIPQRGGVKPLVRGEFDLSYSMLLKIAEGKGSATLCTFDFEGRVGKDGCPAATETAVAMFKDFMADDTAATAKVFVDGGEAARLAEALGLDAEEFKGQKVEDALVIAGRDAKSDYAKIKNALGKNVRAYVFANDKLAGEAGLAPSPAKQKVAPKVQKEVVSADGKRKEKKWIPEERECDVFVIRDRANWEKFPFAGVGPQHLRFRDKLIASKYSAANGFATTGEGMFATDGKVLFDAIDPFQICDRYRSGKNAQAAEVKAGGWGKVPANDKELYLRSNAQSEDNQLRRLSLVFLNWNVPAGKKILERALYTKPVEAYVGLAQYNVLGPWPSKNDDSVYMIDTKDFPVEKDSDNKGIVAEEMAIKGDVQPNPRFKPLGLTYPSDWPQDLHFLDWRPVVKPDQNGMTDLRKLPIVAAQSFNTCYCVGFLERETDGKITLRFGVDWRGAVWVNGKEIIRTYGQTKDEGSVIVKDIPVYAMPKGKTPEEIKKLDNERGTFDGKNVITVKAGSGQSASTFYLRVSKEVKPGDVKRAQVKELDDVKLYQTPNPDFDPYEYVYW